MNVSVVSDDVLGEEKPADMHLSATQDECRSAESSVMSVCGNNGLLRISTEGDSGNYGPLR